MPPNLILVGIFEVVIGIFMSEYYNADITQFGIGCCPAGFKPDLMMSLIALFPTFTFLVLLVGGILIVIGSLLPASKILDNATQP
jgi:uncharacterized membrane protein YphA (DoxX/SURF4 family)